MQPSSRRSPTGTASFAERAAELRGQIEQADDAQAEVNPTR